MSVRNTKGGEKIGSDVGSAGGVDGILSGQKVSSDGCIGGGEVTKQNSGMLAAERQGKGKEKRRRKRRRSGGSASSSANRYTYSPNRYTYSDHSTFNHPPHRTAWVSTGPTFEVLSTLPFTATGTSSTRAWSWCSRLPLRTWTTTFSVRSSPSHSQHQKSHDSIV
jgi:hypothetical protein